MWLLRHLRSLCVALVLLHAAPALLLADAPRAADADKTIDQLTPSRDRIVVGFVDGITIDQQAAILATEPALAPLDDSMVLDAPAYLRGRTVVAHFVRAAGDADIEALLTRLEAQAEVRYANRMLVHRDGTLQGITDRFVVALRSEGDRIALTDMAERTGARIVERYEFNALFYILAADKHAQADARTLAAQFAASGRFAWAEPDYLRFMQVHAAPNDPFYPSQWSLKNTASYFGGIAGADMDVETAWNVTTGSPSIKIAILDDGVELTHVDLAANILPGYDGAGLGSGGGPNATNSHGTSCAGIAAAVGNNGIGVAGVAYNSKIVPVRIGTVSGNSFITTDLIIATCIDWAWNPSGGAADVLSNSWGGGGQSSLIDAAILNAITQGRGGRGSLVLFSSGNSNGALIYPASNPNTIAVGATSMCDERKSPTSCDGENWWGACFGTGLDIAAPGVKIYTTDRSGTAGYTATDFMPTFNGTSSACPNAAGVAALLLSANPWLRHADARRLLESSAEKVGGYTYTANVAGQPNGTWSNDLGYGRVNAKNAVDSATAAYPVVVIGTPTQTCIYPGMTLSFSYSVQSGLVYAGNVFSVQLSDASGSFASPVVIGSAAATTSGSISCTIPPTVANGTGYRVRVVSSDPVATGADNGANITIWSLPAAYAVTGGGGYCTGGTGVPVGLSGSQTGVNYQLLVGGVPTGAPVPGTGSAISFGLQLASGIYTVTGTNTTTGCSSTMTGSASVTIVPYPTVNPVASVTYCAGGATTAITFSGAVPGTTYLWSSSTTAIGIAASGTNTIPAFIATNATTAPIVATITVTPSYTNAGATCVGSSIQFTLTVNPTPTVASVSNQVFCSGAGVPAVVFTSPVPGTTFTWTNSTTSIGLAASGSGNTPAFTAANAGTTPVTATITVTPRYTNNGVTCTGSTTSFTITVNPIPTVNTIANQNLCNGTSSTAVTPAGAVSGTVYTWTNSTPAIGLAASGTGTIPAFTAVNLTTAPIIATIAVTPSYTNAGVTCTGTVRTFTITVNPTPTVNAVASQVRCAGTQTAAITFSGSVPGATFAWTNSNTSIGLASSGTGNIAAFTAINNGTAPVTSTITVTPRFTSGTLICSGTPTTFTITVNPTPNVAAIADQALCHNTMTNAVTPTGTVPGTVFTWTNSNTSIGLAAGGTGGIPAFTAINNGTAPVTATITVTPSYTNAGLTCSGTPRTYVYTVHPLPPASITPLTSVVVCMGDDVVLEANAGTGYSYQWFLDGVPLPRETKQQLTTQRAGAYTVQVRSAFGCPRTSAPVTVTLLAVPDAVATPQGPITFCEGDNVVLEANTGAGYGWQWYKDGTLIAGATQRTYTATTEGEYRVRVTNASNCSRLSAPVDVDVLPLPIAFLRLESQATICTGGTVQMSAHQGPGYTYRWMRDGVFTGATGVTYAASLAGAYTVEVTGANGCRATSNAVTVTVKALPTGSLSPSGPIALCEGESVELLAEDILTAAYTWYRDGVVVSRSGSRLSVSEAGTYSYHVMTRDGCTATSGDVVVTVVPRPVAQITPAGSAAICAGSSLMLDAVMVPNAAYQWLRNGQPIAGATGTMYTAVIDGSYRVRVSIANCAVTSDEVLVRVVPMPDATISADGPTTVCEGTPVQLAVPYVAGMSYRWIHSGVEIPGATGNTYTVTATGVYTARVSTPDGCTSTSDPISVTMLPVPVAAVTPAGPVDVCEGAVIRLEAQRVDRASYAWHLDGAPIPGATGRVYDATSNGAYTVVVTALGGCESTSLPVHVRIRPAPDATVSASGSTTFCEGTGITLSVPFQTGATYQWYLGTVAIANATQSALPVSKPGSYTVVVTNAELCAKRSDPIVIDVLPKPDVSISIDGGSRVVCAGRPVTLRAAGGTGYAYQWLRDGVVLAGETNSTLVVTTSGRYAVSITTSSLCVDQSEEVAITVLDAVRVGVVTGPTTSNPGALTRHTVANPIAGMTYSWFVDGGFIRSGQTSPSIEVEWTRAGNARVSVHAVSECTDTTHVAMNIDGTVAVENAASPDQYHLYPNPAEGDVVLTIPVQAQGRTHEVELYDNLGRLVHREHVAAGRAVHGISTGVLAAGVYRVVLRAGSERVLERLLVRK